MKHEFLKNLEAGQVKVCVIGLGYVGLPLATTFASKHIPVLGFDVSEKRVARLSAGECLIADIPQEEFSKTVKSGQLTFTSQPDQLTSCRAFIICVPTPLDEFRKPDMSYIESAAKIVGHALQKGSLVVLESTTYPTTTENELTPILEKESGLKAGSDFFVCYSPERVDPGNPHFKTENTPKVIGGLTPDCLECGVSLYEKVIVKVHPVSSPRVAEMVKILENTYRLVNISLINELALLCTRMNIDIWEAIDAAKTKPFGFQAFYPGPGIGGHCIPLDPFYLHHIAKSYKFDLSMIEAAGQVNTQMPSKMVVKIAYALNRHKKPLNGSKILFLGVSYKPNIADARESPALEMIEICQHKGAEVFYHDPYIPTLHTEKSGQLSSLDLNKTTLSEMDCVVISTNHSLIDYQAVFDHSTLIVDLRNAMKRKDPKIFRL